MEYNNIKCQYCSTVCIPTWPMIMINAHECYWHCAKINIKNIVGIHFNHFRYVFQLMIKVSIKDTQ